MRAPFSHGGAIGRVGGLILPVGLVGGPVGVVVEGAEQVGAARLELELSGDVLSVLGLGHESLSVPPKFSVSEPRVTAGATLLSGATTLGLVGRPPSASAERGSMAPKPMMRAPFWGAYRCVSQ